MNIASNGLRGNGGLQTTSEVTSDLKIQLSDHDYLCSHVSLASKGLHELNDTYIGGLPSIDLRGFAAGKNLSCHSVGSGSDPGGVPGVRGPLLQDSCAVRRVLPAVVVVVAQVEVRHPFSKA